MRKEMVDNAAARTTYAELDAKPDKIRLVGWRIAEPDGREQFIGYTKERVPGPEGEFCYVMVALDKSSDSDGQTRWTPVHAECFTKSWAAADAAVVWYGRAQGLVPQDFGVNQLTKEYKTQLGNKHRILNHRTVLRVQMLFPWQQADQSPQENAPKVAAAAKGAEPASTAPEDNPHMSANAPAMGAHPNCQEGLMPRSNLAPLHDVAAWFRRMVSVPVRDAQ